VRELDTDYLVVGAGASAMAFVDALLSESPDARVVMVDRQHRPGGHWLDAYPFVQLHQPSANYGVASRRLGEDQVDTSGINAGFYERASAPEICDYYARVMEHDFVGSGRVQFLPMSDYRGEDGDGHHVASRITGATTTIQARKLVDATYVHSEIPSRHLRPYEVDPGVRVIAPNDLVDLAEAPTGFTVIGAGKTSMDTCFWLLDNGVDPDHIRWIRPRDPWLFNRAFMQPLDLVGSFMQMQAGWIEAAAVAPDAADFAHRLEDRGVLVRLDPQVEPRTWRGAVLSSAEVESLRRIERVVREEGYVRRIGSSSVQLDAGEVPSSPGEVYVDCTAVGIRQTAPLPIFNGNRIVLQYVTIGIVPWSMATIGTVEALRDDDTEKNRLCPPLTFHADASDMLQTVYTGMIGLVARGSEPDIGAWNEQCRLNPAAGAMSRLDDPDVASALTTMVEHIGAAMENLASRVAPTRL
jgi:NAD(P)-binding Rossmann-like domain